MPLVTEETLPKTKEEFKQLLLDKSKTGMFPCFDGRCYYRSDDGTRACIVGLLIPDDEYSREIENLDCNAFTDISRFLHIPAKVSILLLEALQMLHDTHAFRMHRNKTAWEHEEFEKEVDKLFTEF